MRRAVLLLFSLLAFACSDATVASGEPDASPDARVLHRDAGAPDGPACNTGRPGAYPATHPPLPLLQSFGGPVLATPRFVPIVFKGEPLRDEIATVHSEIAASLYWKERAGEYGVGPAVADAPIVVDETPASTVSEGDIVQWLMTKLDGAHAGFGLPDSNAIYTLYYPGTTKLTTAWGESCSIGGFGGYHSELKIGGKPYVFAVIARCKPDVDEMTTITAHELFEAATDPYFTSAPAFGTLGNGWAGRTEVGDLCESEPSVLVPGVTHRVPPMWSNVAQSRAAHPCVPNNGAAEFSTLADLPDATLRLAPGDDAAVELVFFSDAKTPPWTVKVWSNDREVTLSLCQNQGANGDRVRLEIDRGSLSDVGGTDVYVQSDLGQRSKVTKFRVANP